MTVPRRQPAWARIAASGAGVLMALALPLIAGSAAAEPHGAAGAPPPADSRTTAERLAHSGPLDANGGTGAHTQARPVPVLAYFYIWFKPSSWNRAKIDYPLIGRYSSDDVAVMRRQVREAQRAGITGFLVSWKNTPVLNRRLANLRKVAAAAGFKLSIVFEGRDFHGQPLPMTEVDSSFRYLAAHYAGDPVFHLFGKPLVMWSGTWAYRRSELASITRTYGSALLILASEKQVARYQAIASIFHGDSYYWSSADPLRTPGYAAKLHHFSAAVHASGGLWIAPAAAGFDARLVGGARVVPRRGGQTLRTGMNAAIDSSPDAIGLISWNEYSENSEVEPSRVNGATSLNVIANIERAKSPVVADFNSSDPSGFNAGPSQFVTLGALVVMLAGSVIVIIFRRGKA